MEADEYPVVDGAPLRIFFLAIDAKFIKVFLYFKAIFLGEIDFLASNGFRSQFFKLFINKSILILLVFFILLFELMAVISLLKGRRRSPNRI